MGGWSYNKIRYQIIFFFFYDFCCSLWNSYHLSFFWCDCVKCDISWDALSILPVSVTFSKLFHSLYRLFMLNTVCFLN